MRRAATRRRARPLPARQARAMHHDETVFRLGGEIGDEGGGEGASVRNDRREAGAGDARAGEAHGGVGR